MIILKHEPLRQHEVKTCQRTSDPSPLGEEDTSGNQPRPAIAEKRYQNSDQHYQRACKLDEGNGTMGRSHQCEMVDGQRRQQLPRDNQSNERAHTGAGHQDDVAEQSKRPDHAASNTDAGCAGMPASSPPCNRIQLRKCHWTTQLTCSLLVRPSIHMARTRRLSPWAGA